MVVYKLTNLVNGKIYVGQTRGSLPKRFRKHCERANKGAKGKLYPAMRKYGIINFKPEVLEEIPADKENSIQVLNEREKY